MSTEEIELTGIDYLFKFAERLRIVVEGIKCGGEIADDDYDGVVKAVHSIMEQGECPFYRTICTDKSINVTQINLFSANTSVS